MEHVSVVLSLCIGNMIAWLLALYTPQGVSLLPWNVVFGFFGALLCGLTIARLVPDLGVGGFLAGAPLCALLTIQVLHAARRRL